MFTNYRSLSCHFSIGVNRINTGVRNCVFKSWSSHFSSVWLWADFLTSLCINLLMCKMDILIESSSQGCYEDWINAWRGFKSDAWHIIIVQKCYQFLCYYRHSPRTLRSTLENKDLRLSQWFGVWEFKTAAESCVSIAF